MPYNLSRQTFKSAQRAVEHTSASVLKDLTSAQKTASKPKTSPEKTLEDVDGMITKLSNLKRKLEGLHSEETKLTRASRARIQHLQTLYEVQSLVDVKYDEWSRVRLTRLLVDYLLRMGYSESAAALASSKGIEELVDVDAFISVSKIEKSLREGHSTVLALAWCKENGQALKKMAGRVEYELRLQQYIEMVRSGHQMQRRSTEEFEGGNDELWNQGKQKLVEARVHAKKFLGMPEEIDVFMKASGLLAYKPWDEVEPYMVCYICIVSFVGRFKFTDVVYRVFIRTNDGRTSQNFFSKHITRYSTSRDARSSTSRYLQVSRR